ncbi:MAG TPA: hypothetical protein ENN22_02600 [bacterium]|nr:hypothetical protein [bacterium]
MARQRRRTSNRSKMGLNYIEQQHEETDSSISNTIAAKSFKKQLEQLRLEKKLNWQLRKLIDRRLAALDSPNK